MLRVPAQCPACLRLSDVMGDHALCCGTGGERISRHNALRDAFFDTAVSAGLGPSKEGRFLLPGADRRPADILVPLWAGGRDAAFDVTVVHPLQDATVVRAATEPGHALNFAHDRKLRGAEEDCRQQGIAFLPLVAESFGWLASMRGEGGEEAWQCAGQAHRAAGGGSHRPPLGQTWHPAPTGKCCHTGQQGAQFPPS